MSLSTYEEQRMERIAGNRDIMLSLGLDKSLPASARQPARKSPKKPQERVEPLLPTRRSTRGTRAPELFGLPSDWHEPAADERRPQRRARYEEASAENGDGASESKSEAEVMPKRKVKPAKPSCNNAGPPDSSRNLVAEVALLENVIGQRVPGGNVKAGVMQFVSPKVVPRFSKYVGVQEWVNSVFLMMNMVAGSYDNAFIKTKTGMQMSYFLSERTSPEAPIVYRLQRVQADNSLGVAAKLIKTEDADAKQETEAWQEEEAGARTGNRAASSKGKGKAAPGVKCELETEEFSANLKPELDHHDSSGAAGKRKRSNVGSRDSVHLFCRPAPETYKQLNLAHADYVYLGRLGYISCDTDKIPIKFVFELLDYSILSSSQEFKDLLALAKR